MLKRSLYPFVPMLRLKEGKMYILKNVVCRPRGLGADFLLVARAQRSDSSGEMVNTCLGGNALVYMELTALFLLCQALGLFVRCCAVIYTHLHLTSMTDELTNKPNTVVFSFKVVCGLRLLSCF